MLSGLVSQQTQQQQQQQQLDFYLNLTRRRSISGEKIFVDQGEFTAYHCRKSAHYVILADEEYRDITLEWVQVNACFKLTVFHFQSWVNDSLFPTIEDHHPQIPYNYQHPYSKMIATCSTYPSPTHKGVCTLMATSEDVVQYRILSLIKETRNPRLTHAPPPPIQ